MSIGDIDGARSPCGWVFAFSVERDFLRGNDLETHEKLSPELQPNAGDTCGQRRRQWAGDGQALIPELRSSIGEGRPTAYLTNICPDPLPEPKRPTLQEERRDTASDTGERQEGRGEFDRKCRAIAGDDPDILSLRTGAWSTVEGKLDVRHRDTSDPHRWRQEFPQ